jgi:E3 ubiquitin-protein ligase RNF115/126
VPRPGEQRGDGQPGMPIGLQGIFASLLNPANARHGDAVYSQEALDQIISNLMEQHPTSNAPGPASPDAIASLPKQKLDEKLLGPEGKGECSVCMDDVKIGDEVVVLPCNHWFHETCAGMWLGEHNTCPICRKGIEGEAPTAEGRRSSQAGPTAPTTRNEHRARRLSQSGYSARSDAAANRNPVSGRNEGRLNSIRSAAGLPPEEPHQPRRWQVVGEPNRNDDDEYTRRMPGSYRRRDSEMSADNERESRRGNTSGSDLSRESRRSSHSGNGGGSSGNGAMAWLRDRFSRHD